MFVSANQFYVFIACIGFGSVMGVVYSPILAVKSKIKSRVLKVVSDVSFFAVLCFTYALFSFYSDFPSLRAYMIAGVFMGIILYVKSFNIILAKFARMIYNKIVKTYKKRKTKDDRGQV